MRVVVLGSRLSPMISCGSRLGGLGSPGGTLKKRLGYWLTLGTSEIIGCFEWFVS